ncbi:hypothetical protein CFP65_6221 [Kitasatospora sp. MMS16-BH015]|uniref:hypothetical protein n=1 Tax=Kitasatospora sp. MMS16-BH015 TaxID=2018025 RepID=UPI000CA2F407|nr:hypothetical protein [Kitasatospora sp. MMS16-BH015]AUG80886.1 hypothetical protein CFP65_6221 [Kitasatospora sp. MMS16-BH015]
MKTQAITVATAVEHLTAQLASLPPGTALDIRDPRLPTATLGSNLSRSDWDDPPGEEPGPVFAALSARYWVLGMDPTDTDPYVDLFKAAWQGLGWPVEEHEDLPRSAYARTPDGYHFGVIQSLSGHLSLSVNTPDFLLVSAAEARLPDRLDHPA